MILAMFVILFPLVYMEMEEFYKTSNIILTPSYTLFWFRIMDATNEEKKYVMPIVNCYLT